MADKAPALVGVSVTTVGSGDYSCGAALAPPDVSVPFRAFNSGVINDGDTFPYVCRQGSTFERGRGTWHSGTNSITRTLITSNSNNNVSPITWGAGTKILFIDDGEGVTARSALGLGAAAVLNTGVGANLVVVQDGSGKVVTNTDLSQCINLPTHTHNALVLTGFTGGSNSTIVRPTSATTVTAAALSDAPATLQVVWAKGSDGNIYAWGIVPFTGAAYGNRYYLGTAGAISTTFSNGVNDTPDGTHTALIVGYGIGAGLLFFDPKPPVGGVLSSGTAVKLEHVDFKV